MRRQTLLDLERSLVLYRCHINQVPVGFLGCCFLGFSFSAVIFFHNFDWKFLVLGNTSMTCGLNQQFSPTWWRIFGVETLCCSGVVRILGGSARWCTLGWNIVMCPYRYISMNSSLKNFQVVFINFALTVLFFQCYYFPITILCRLLEHKTLPIKQIFPLKIAQS